jgi:hypothetical protein
VDEPGRGVALTHLGWDLALVGDEQRTRESCVLAKNLVDLSPGAGADFCKAIG